MSNSPMFDRSAERKARVFSYVVPEIFRFPGSPARLDAWYTATPGLIVARISAIMDHKQVSGWSLTHEPTGLAIISGQQQWAPAKLFWVAGCLGGFNIPWDKLDAREAQAAPLLLTNDELLTFARLTCSQVFPASALAWYRQSLTDTVKNFDSFIAKQKEKVARALAPTCR